MTKLQFYTLMPGKHIRNIAMPDNRGVIINAAIDEVLYIDPSGNLVIVTEDNCHLFELQDEL